MPLWGTSAANESKPKYLTDEQKEQCYATGAGWAIKRPDGEEEILVSIRGLSTRLAAASITEVKFASGSYVAGATKSVKVSFNEKVAVTGNPTLVVTGSVAGAVTATYASTNANGTVLTFNFTVPAADNVLTVGAQSVSLAGGTIVEQAAGATAASLVITSAVATAAGSKTAVAA